MAPSNFGPFGGDLLIGNKGNGTIDAYNFTTGVLAPFILANGTPFEEPGLSALAFGNGVTGNSDAVYFTAGINNQQDGLFGSISLSVVPEPSSGLLLILGGLIVGACQVARNRVKNRETS